MAPGFQTALRRGRCEGTDGLAEPFRQEWDGGNMGLSMIYNGKSENNMDDLGVHPFSETSKG